MNELDTPTVSVNIEEFYTNNSTENLDLASPNIYSYFNDLYYIDVGEHIEKKNDLSYLSWPYAVAEISKRFPDFQYKILTFGKDNLPYMLDEKTGYMVWTEVTIQGITRKMWLPVMDGANKSMKDKPYTYKTKYGEKTVEAATMFDINKAIMRCLVKNFAMFGLGLYIYAGEDLPEESDEEKARKEEAKKQAEAKKNELSAMFSGIQSYIAKKVESGVSKNDIGEVIKKKCVINGKPSFNFTKVKTLEEAKSIFEELVKTFGE